MSKQCPVCKQDAVVKIDGYGWDWDKEMCMSRGCEYEIELDTMTCYEPDGSVYVIKKEDLNEDE